jgi:hypothetical protein
MVFSPEWFIVFRLIFVFDDAYRLLSFLHQAFRCHQVFHGIDIDVLIADHESQNDFPVVNAALNQVTNLVFATFVVICVTLKF